MISGFVSPGEPLSMDLNIPKLFQKISETDGSIELYYYFANHKFGRIKKTNCWNRFGKGERRQIMDIRQTKPRQDWIWDQYLPGNMKWRFCEFLKPRNHTTMKP